jgi:hypothetical protein
MQTILSLVVAMEEAGGTLTEEALESMSAVELIELIAPNNIRFTNVCPTPNCR